MDLPVHEGTPAAKDETSQLLRASRVSTRVNRLLGFARLATRFILAAPLRDRGGGDLKVKLQAIDPIPMPKRLMAAGERCGEQFAAAGKFEGFAMPVKD